MGGRGRELRARHLGRRGLGLRVYQVHAATSRRCFRSRRTFTPSKRRPRPAFSLASRRRHRKLVRYRAYTRSTLPTSRGTPSPARSVDGEGPAVGRHDRSAVRSTPATRSHAIHPGTVLPWGEPDRPLARWSVVELV